MNQHRLVCSPELPMLHPLCTYIPTIPSQSVLLVFVIFYSTHACNVVLVPSTLGIHGLGASQHGIFLEWLAGGSPCCLSKGYRVPGERTIGKLVIQWEGNYTSFKLPTSQFWERGMLACEAINQPLLTTDVGRVLPLPQNLRGRRGKNSRRMHQQGSCPCMTYSVANNCPMVY